MAALAEGWYLVKNEADGLYLGIAQGRKTGDHAVQEELGTEQARAGQLWRLRPHDAQKGTWRLQNLRTSLYLDVMTNRRRAGAPVVLCNEESREDLLASQLWRLPETGEGLYSVVNANSGKHLAVKDDSHSAGAELVQAEPRTGTDSGTQGWRLERLPSRGERKAFDALTATVVTSGGGLLGGAMSGLTDAFKHALDTGGGLFETAAKGISDPKAPYVRFDGFRGEEFVRFSQHHGIEAGPKKITEQFPHLPEKFHGGFDAVTVAPKGSKHTYLGFTGNMYVEFSERGIGETGPHHIDPQEFPGAEEVQKKGRWYDIAPGTPDGKVQLLFGKGTAWPAEWRGAGFGPDPYSKRSIHFPGEFSFEPDAAASAALDKEMHYFLVKGGRYAIVTQEKVVQGPTRLTDSYPFLDGLWM